MNCFPESTYSVYVDRELPDDEVRAVESHLIQCQDCRGVILALEEEAGSLGDLLKQHYQGWRAVIIAGDPGKGKYIGLRPSLRLPVRNGKIEARILRFELY